MIKNRFAIRIYSLALTIVLAVVCPFALAASNADLRSCEIAASGALPPPKLMAQESSVELEIDASDSVLNMITTLDGTIRPLWVQGQVITDMPKDIFESLKEAFPDISPLDAPWDVLTPDEQRRLLMAVAPTSRDQFFDNRTVRGLKYKEFVTLTFFKPTRFAGKIYPAGTHKLKTADIFANTKIEYMGPERMRERLGFELHIRSFYSAGDNLITARNLSMALIGRVSPLHLHIVAPYPGAYPDKYQALRMTAAHQNWTMLHDLLLMERRGAIDQYGDGFYAYSEREVHDFFNTIRMTATGWADIHQIHSKQGTVGLRTHHYYDQLVWGIESRYLSPQIPDARLYQMLNRIQEQMLSGEFTSTMARAQRYTGYYFGNVNPKVAFMRADAAAGDEDASFFYRHYNRNAMVVYLYRDFKNHVEFFGNEKLIKQIQDAQKYGIALLKGGMNSTEVMELFARKSGLRHYFSQQYPGVLP